MTLGIVILLMVMVYALKPSQALQHNPQPLSGRVLIVSSMWMMPIAYYSGWLSAGSGIFTTFVYIYLLKYDQLRASAMTIVANGIFWNGVGAIAHFTMGHIIWQLAPGLVLGALIGSYMGAGFGIKKGNGFLRVMFIISAAATGIMMFL